MLPVANATRYVTPLREGGSLPALVEASDLGTYVMKFHGAGQGARVLAAEVIVARVAALLGLRVPALTALSLSPAIARYEADEEVQDLLNRSLGLNLGIDFLPGSFGFDARSVIDEREAATILWLDAFVVNVAAAGATRTSWSGTAQSGASTMAPRCTSITAGPTP